MVAIVIVIVVILIRGVLLGIVIARVALGFLPDVSARFLSCRGSATMREQNILERGIQLSETKLLMLN